MQAVSGKDMPEVIVLYSKGKGGKGRKSDFRLVLESLEVGQEMIASGRTHSSISPILREVKKGGKKFSTYSVPGGICIARLASVDANSSNSGN